MLRRLKKTEQAIVDRLNSVNKYPSEYEDPEGYEYRMLGQLADVRLLAMRWLTCLICIIYALFGIVKLSKDIFRG